MVFGRATTPVNFVSADDVAAFVERALTDERLRGEVIDVGGPENHTLRQVVAMYAQAAGVEHPKVRRIPRPMLRITAALMPRINPPLARQSEAAISMDTGDMTFDATASRARFSEIPATTMTHVVDAMVRAARTSHAGSSIPTS